MPGVDKRFVPRPSFASTELEEKERVAAPVERALNVTVIILPFAPVNPGFKTIPSKLTVPALFENDGSRTQRETIDPACESETTSSVSAGNEITPEAAFIACVGLEMPMPTEIVVPTACDPDEGENCSVAAYATEAERKNI